MGRRDLVGHLHSLKPRTRKTYICCGLGPCKNICTWRFAFAWPNCLSVTLLPLKVPRMNMYAHTMTSPFCPLHHACDKFYRAPSVSECHWKTERNLGTTLGPVSLHFWVYLLWVCSQIKSFDVRIQYIHVSSSPITPHPHKYMPLVSFGESSSTVMHMCWVSASSMYVLVCREVTDEQ